MLTTERGGWELFVGGKNANSANGNRDLTPSFSVSRSLSVSLSLYVSLYLCLFLTLSLSFCPSFSHTNTRIVFYLRISLLTFRIDW